MAMYSRTESVIEGGSDFKVLPSGKYIMEIVTAEETENKFGKPNKDGSPKMQVMIRWELKKLNSAQQAILDNDPASADYDEEAPSLEPDETLDIGATVMQYMTPLYATIKDRDTGQATPTPWKTFVDTLAEQDIIGDEFDLDQLVGTVQLVTVNKEPKQNGPNKGKMGNKVAKIGPVPTKKSPKLAKPVLPVEDDEDMPF